MNEVTTLLLVSPKGFGITKFSIYYSCTTIVPPPPPPPSPHISYRSGRGLVTICYVT